MSSGPGGEAAAFPPSLWAATAIPPAATTALQGDRSTEVAIVGAGYTGAAAALHLAEQGVEVVALDAVDVGWGASGRNNGQVIPGHKLDPEGFVELLGRERGERLAAWAGAAPALVFELIARHGIDCSPTQTGWIQPAYTRQAVPVITERCRQWRERGADVEMLDPASLRQLLGTSAFYGAWMDRRGGSIQPLSYARGLAGAAIKAGAVIHTRTRVQALETRGDQFRLVTAGGTVTAKRVILASAGYSDELVPGLTRSFVPVRTAQVATAPLAADVRATILPGRQPASDTRRLLTSFRLSPDGRLVMGGSGATGGQHKRSLEGHLHRAAAELFPHLPPMPWEFGWSGYFATTSDHVPHLFEPQPNLVIGLGCNGRGIALSTAMGRLLAERLLGRPAADLPLPVTVMKPYAFHRFRHLGIAAATVSMRWRDRADRRSSAAGRS